MLLMVLEELEGEHVTLLTDMQKQYLCNIYMFFISDVS